MAIILGTDGISEAIEDIMIDARNGVIIICPYLKISCRIKRLLSSASDRGIKFLVIYGKDREMREDTRSFLESLDPMMILFLKDLHAKLYMNERQALVTSMNLHEYSQIHNEELGVLFDSTEDPDKFRQLQSYVIHLTEEAEEEYVSPSVDDEAESDDGTRFIPEGLECHCIRCGIVLPPTNSTVYCGRCMSVWAIYGNTRYTEAYGSCFICGKPFMSSAIEPSCPRCRNSHPELVEDFVYWMDLVSRSDNLLMHYMDAI